mgnify:CR=1 FL=1
MAFYSYKHVAHAWPHDMIERWEAAEGREFDGDYNYSGDGWLVASMWIDELIEASSKRDAEIAKLRAENARLREAMPTDGDRDVLDSLYRATVELVTGGGMFPASARAEDELAKARAWLARMDAAKGVR